nr:hypothetical protein BaRGS_031557 [Batillaria attramentaria]
MARGGDTFPAPRMMHAVDWFPTIITAAGGVVKNTDIDGVSMWDAITSMGPSPRTGFVYNLDNMNPPVEGHAAIREGDYKLIKGWPGRYSDWYPPDQEYDEQDSDLSLAQELEAPDLNTTRLYNIKDDPTEHVDLAEQLPDVVAKLEQRMAEYMKQYVKADFPAMDPAGSPSNYGGSWTPGWC